MIIDMRTQIEATANPWADVCAGSPEAHARAMACVDTAIVAGWRSDRLGVDMPCESIASFVMSEPDRLVGFAGVDPMAESAVDDLRKARDLGLAGVTLAPADQGYRPTHDRCMDVLAAAASMGMPALIANPFLTDRRSMMEFARPSLLDEALRELPTLTVILGDLEHGWIDEALLLTAKHARVYVEMSGLVSRTWSLYTALQSALEMRVMDKLLFASGFPRQTPERAIERLYSINSLRTGSALPTIPRESLRSIVERDALAAIGVDHLPARRRPAPVPDEVVTAPAEARPRLEA